MTTKLRTNPTTEGSISTSECCNAASVTSPTTAGGRTLNTSSVMAMAKTASLKNASRSTWNAVRSSAGSAIGCYSR